MFKIFDNMFVFQSSFELTGYITFYYLSVLLWALLFQSSFELTGYITEMIYLIPGYVCREFQSSFELTGYITKYYDVRKIYSNWVSKLFRAYGLYNINTTHCTKSISQFQSSFELTGYITEHSCSKWIKVIAVSKLFRAYGLYNGL